MDIQNQALIAEIERFKTESLKTHIVKFWADSYVNSNPFGYAILQNGKVWWMKAQAHQLWEMWQAAKAVPEGFVLIAQNSKTVVAIEKMVEQQVEASGITTDVFRLDGYRILEAMIEAQEQSHD